MKNLVELARAEIAADALWRSLSRTERRAYAKAHPRSRFAARADMNPRDWFDSMSPEQQKKYLAEHPNSKAGKAGNAPAPAPSKVSGLIDHVKGLPSHTQEAFHRLSDNSKQALHDWHGKSPAEKAKTVASGVANIGKTAAHHAVHVVKHEAKMYGDAGKAIGHLATGKKWSELHPDHRKHLKHALIHAGITAASMAMGDPSGHAGHGAAHALGVGDILTEFAHHHAHHAATLGAGEVGLKTGKDVLKKAVASEKLPPNVQKEAEKAMKALVGADIPTATWIHIMEEIEKRMKQQAGRK